MLGMSSMSLRELRGNLSRAGHAPSLVAALAYFDVSFMVWVLLGAAGGVGGFVLVSGFGWLAGATGTESSAYLFLGVVAATAALAARNRHRSWRPTRATGASLERSLERSLEVAV
jgi:nitrate/nitrite transporter NarK